MLFCEKSSQSAKVLRIALSDFSSWSGLSPNHLKSNIFIAGSNPDYLEALRSEFQFQVGTLLVKYLGLPLITSRLSAADCKPMVDSMLA